MFCVDLVVAGCLFEPQQVLMSSVSAVQAAVKCEWGLEVFSHLDSLQRFFFYFPLDLRLFVPERVWFVEV